MLIRSTADLSQFNSAYNFHRQKYTHNHHQNHQLRPLKSTKRNCIIYRIYVHEALLVSIKDWLFRMLKAERLPPEIILRCKLYTRSRTRVWLTSPSPARWKPASVEKTTSFRERDRQPMSCTHAHSRNEWHINITNWLHPQRQPDTCTCTLHELMELKNGAHSAIIGIHVNK